MSIKVYKYLAFSDGGRAVLTDGTHKFSCFNEFNDPFDCIAEYNIEKSMGYLLTRSNVFKKIGDELKISPAKRIQKKNHFLKIIERSILSGEYHEDVVRNVGISCFSHNDDNILMWSHYADNHKGFVVEFEVDFSRQGATAKNVDWTLIGYDVKYQEDMPVLEIGKGDFESVKKLFLTKSLDWEYESEYRVLTMNKGPGIHKFDQKLISRVIAGAKMSENDFKNLIILVNNLSKKTGRKIVVDRASMVPGKYKLKTT